MSERDDIKTTAKDLASDWAMPETEETCALAIAAALLAERERCAKICEAEAEAFLSPQYATNQPLGSFCERFACEQCAAAIRKETD